MKFLQMIPTALALLLGYSLMKIDAYMGAAWTLAAAIALAIMMSYPLIGRFIIEPLLQIVIRRFPGHEATTVLLVDTPKDRAYTEQSLHRAYTELTQSLYRAYTISNKKFKNSKISNFKFKNRN